MQTLTTVDVGQDTDTAMTFVSLGDTNVERTSHMDMVRVEIETKAEIYPALVVTADDESSIEIPKDVFDRLQKAYEAQGRAEDEIMRYVASKYPVPEFQEWVDGEGED